MASLPYVLLVWLLSCIGVFHVVLGAGLMLSPRFQAIVASLYGAWVDWTAQAVFFVRSLGVFAFVIGCLALAAAWNPLRHQAIVYGLILLFLVRDAHRLMFHREIQQAFELPPSRTRWTNVLLLAQAVALFVLLKLSC